MSLLTLTRARYTKRHPRKPAALTRELFRRLAVERLEDRSVPAGFSYPDFGTPTGLTLVGDATFTADHRLRLTPALGGQAGAAWFTAGKQFVGLAFETTFQFQMSEKAVPQGGADGMVFIIQNTAPNYFSGGGGGSLAYDGLTNSLAVEFDTCQNTDYERNDPSPSHISVHTNGTGTNGSQEALSIGSYNTYPALLNDAAVHTVKIAYTPGTLSIYLDNLTTPKLSVSVDMAERLALDAGRAWVGFTGATGGGWETHDVLSWTYTPMPDVTTTVSASDAATIEGNSGSADLVFAVTRAGATTGTTTVNWATENRTATAGSDYAATAGQLTFGPGVTQQTVTIIAHGDTAIEPHETLALRLTGSTGASIADGVGIGSILTDDVTISVDDATATEGDARIRQALGAFVSQSGNGGLGRSTGMAWGPDGNLYVGSHNTNQILRYDGTTGAFLGTFIDASGGLATDSPWIQGLQFRPDGKLYVLSRDTSQVQRFDAATGAFLDVFVPSGSGGLSRAKGMTVGPDGNWYINSGDTNQVLRYSGTTGAFLGVFVTGGSGGLSNPRALTFGPDGNLYVSSSNSNAILRYHGQTGAFLSAFIPTGSGGLAGPAEMVFSAGSLYVASENSNEVLRYDAQSGVFLDKAATAALGGLDGPLGLLLDSNNNLLVGSFGEILRYGPPSRAAATVRLNFPCATPVTVNFATASGSATAGNDFTPMAGSLTFAPGQTERTIFIQTLNDALAEGNESFTINLSNPVGATITDGTAVATITDDDATKFFVVDDGGTDRTYRYGVPGNPLANSTLSSGNTTPRGAASTAAGTTVWVVDANKTVYIYNTGGALLGSWTAGGLNGSAQLEGLATNGTDVWLVDAKQDKVFKYTGAASRLSGSQSAASNFSLASGNTNPKGIVTDGTALWVVDDGSTNKVFKYTLTGLSLGNWTIDATNASPTGLTINPASVSDIWIVDSGTDKVYQYTAAAGRTSGSQTASATFALAAGNTNPQDIADPPAISIDDATATEGSATIRFIDDFVSTGSGGLGAPKQQVFRNGNLFVASASSKSVLWYEGTSGNFLGAFVSTGAGGLDDPFGITFGPDGNLYVSCTSTNRVLKYDGASGGFVSEFVTAGAGGLANPRDVIFGPDGNLYVASSRSDQVLRYQGPGGPAPGAFMNVFAATGGGSSPFGLAFGPDGNLFVACTPLSGGVTNSGFVARFNGSTGAFLDTFIPTGTGGLKDPRSLVFDREGNIYMSNGFADGGVLRYQGPGGPSPGSFLGVYVPPGLGGLDSPLGLVFDQDSNLYVASRSTHQVLRYGSASLTAFTARLTEPSATPVTVNFSTTDGTGVAGSDYKTATSTVTFSPGQTARTILVQTFDDTLSEPGETFTVNLSNPVGATITDGQAVGTISDNEPLQVASAAVNGGAAQRSRVTDLTVTFTGLATLPANLADAFRLTRTGPTGLTGDVALTVDLSASTATQTIARLTFGGSLTEFGSLIDGTYTLTVLGDQVTGNGQALDGDADGTPGGDYAFNLHRLFGDANGDRVVNGSDVTPFIQQFGGPSPDFDFNGDGVVNGADLTEFVKNFGRGI